MVGDDLIPQPLLEATANGAGNDTPLLLGCTEHEFSAPLSSHLREHSGTDPVTALLAAGIDTETVDAAMAYEEDGWSGPLA